jgi:hypothetical protein
LRIPENFHAPAFNCFGAVLAAAVGTRDEAEVPDEVEEEAAHRACHISSSKQNHEFVKGMPCD